MVYSCGGRGTGGGRRPAAARCGCGGGLHASGLPSGALTYPPTQPPNPTNQLHRHTALPARPPTTCSPSDGDGVADGANWGGGYDDGGGGGMGAYDDGGGGGMGGYDDGGGDMGGYDYGGDMGGFDDGGGDFGGGDE